MTAVINIQMYCWTETVPYKYSAVLLKSNIAFLFLWSAVQGLVCALFFAGAMRPLWRCFPQIQRQGSKLSFGVYIQWYSWFSSALTVAALPCGTQSFNSFYVYCVCSYLNEFWWRLNSKWFVKIWKIVYQWFGNWNYMW